MKNTILKQYKKGAQDSLTVVLGYFSIAIAFGMITRQNGYTPFYPMLMSLFIYSGTGQFISSELLASGARLSEIIITLLTLNLRFTLMSVSLSQKLSSKVKMGHRIFLAFGNTDETFAIAMNTEEELTTPYLLGLFTAAYSGWFAGTVVGVYASSLIPEGLTSALSISLYAMLIAIVIPKAKESSAYAFVIMISLVVSGGLSYLLSREIIKIDSSWIIIISGVVSATVMAIISPIKEKDVVLAKENENTFKSKHLEEQL